MAGEHVEIELEVLADLEDGRILEQRLQKRQRLLERQLGDLLPVAEIELDAALGVAERHVAGLARRRREREADEVGAHGIEPGRLGVEGDAAGGICVGDPRLEPLSRRHRLIL